MRAALQLILQPMLQVSWLRVSPKVPVNFCNWEQDAPNVILHDRVFSGRSMLTGPGPKSRRICALIPYPAETSHDR